MKRNIRGGGSSPLSKRKGQTSAEYAVMAALALAVVAGLVAFASAMKGNILDAGNGVADTFAALSEEGGSGGGSGGEGDEPQARTINLASNIQTPSYSRCAVAIHFTLTQNNSTATLSANFEEAEDSQRVILAPEDWDRSDAASTVYISQFGLGDNDFLYSGLPSGSYVLYFERYDRRASPSDNIVHIPWNGGGLPGISPGPWNILTVDITTGGVVSDVSIEQLD